MSGRSRAKRRIAVALFLSLLSTGPGSTGSADGATASVAVEITGMTFAASRADDSELRLRADLAHFRPETRKAELEGVHATLSSAGRGDGLEMRCERGLLDLEANSFRAMGEVRGRTEDGREFSTEWVDYDHVAGVLMTRAPVVITDAGITYRGGGFDYDISEQRFRLLGGASVVQDR